jgi:hypothetical protein
MKNRTLCAASVSALLSLILVSPVSAQPGPGGGGPGGNPGAGGGFPGGPGGGRGGAGRGGFEQYDHNDTSGYVQIFDGRTLDGWDYAPDVWRVEDGAIVAGGVQGVNPGTTFATYMGAEPGDFDLLVDVMTEGTNTGLQIRSFQNDITTPADGPSREQQRTLAAIDRDTLNLRTGVSAASRELVASALMDGATAADRASRAQALAAAELTLALARADAIVRLQSGAQRLNATQLASVRTTAGRGGPIVPYAVWNVAGYQADFPAVGNVWEGGRFGGTFNGERINERGNLTTGGNITITAADPAGRTHRVLATLPTSDENGPFFRQNDWNQYHVMARGNVIILFLNGKMMSMTIDENPVMSRARGIIALQIEGAGPVRFRNIWLKQSPVSMGPTPTQ